MPAILIKYDDLDLTEDLATLIENEPSRLNMQGVPRRHGGIVQDGVVLDPRVIQFQSRLQDSTALLLRTKLDTWKKTFNRTNKKFRVWDDRYINAYKTEFAFQYVPGSSFRAADFSITIRCPDPFWYSDTASTSTRNLTSADTLVSGVIYKEAFTLTNNGNVFAVPKITVLANGANLSSIRVRNLTTGKTWIYTGTVTNGQSLVVDQAIFRVDNNGTEDLTNWTGDFVTLDVGANSMEVEGHVPADYTFNWTDRWY